MGSRRQCAVNTFNGNGSPVDTYRLAKRAVRLTKGRHGRMRFERGAATAGELWRCKLQWDRPRRVSVQKQHKHREKTFGACKSPPLVSTVA